MEQSTKHNQGIRRSFDKEKSMRIIQSLRDLKSKLNKNKYKMHNNKLSMLLCATSANLDAKHEYFGNKYKNQLTLHSRLPEELTNQNIAIMESLSPFTPTNQTLFERLTKIADNRNLKAQMRSKRYSSCLPELNRQSNDYMYQSPSNSNLAILSNLKAAQKSRAKELEENQKSKIFTKIMSESLLQINESDMKRHNLEIWELQK